MVVQDHMGLWRVGYALVLDEEVLAKHLSVRVFEDEFEAWLAVGHAARDIKQKLMLKAAKERADKRRGVS